MRGAINWPVLRVIDPLNDVSLFADSGVGKNGVSCRQVFEVGLERTNVGRRSPGNVVSKSESGCNLLGVLESGELANSNAHGVPGMNQTVRDRHDSAVAPI